MDNGASATRAVQRFDLARSFRRAAPQPQPEPDAEAEAEVPAKRTMRLAAIETAKMAAFDRVRREREPRKARAREIVLVRTPLDSSPRHAVAAAWALAASASIVAAASVASAAAYLLCFPHF